MYIFYSKHTKIKRAKRSKLSDKKKTKSSKPSDLFLQRNYFYILYVNPKLKENSGI